MSWSGKWGKNRTDRLFDSFDHGQNSSESCLRVLSMSLEIVIETNKQTKTNEKMLQLSTPGEKLRNGSIIINILCFLVVDKFNIMLF